MINSLSAKPRLCLLPLTRLCTKNALTRDEIAALVAEVEEGAGNGSEGEGGSGDSASSGEEERESRRGKVRAAALKAVSLGFRNISQLQSLHQRRK